jgi:C-terminal processing protease CtpA/Prc
MAGATLPSRERRRAGLFVWCVRIFGGVAVLAVVVFCALFATYRFVFLPQQQAGQQRQAAAFARLKGPARRLAIYDAFVDQIDRHYYDQSFSGMDWPRLRREWRPKAAAAPDDWRLYWDVLIQVTMRFPASHVGVSMPGALAPAPHVNQVAAAGPAAKPAAPCTERDAGTQFVMVRRGKGVGSVVGEVWPGSSAARAGVTPGWLVQSWKDSAGLRGERNVEADFTRLTPDQMHVLESGGSVQVENAAALRQRIAFSYRCGGRAGPFETRRLAGGAIYIRFDEFQAPVLKEVEAALRTADDRGAVMDLRSNHGGYAIMGLNLLLAPGRPVYFERDAGGRRLRSTGLLGWRYRGPLAVLVGPASASAAEVTAAALEHEHRAVIVGRRTNGSVLGSNTYPLPDGGSVQVPVTDVEMLDGRPLEGAGVAPDIEVYPTAADLSAGRDAALERGERELLKR